MKLVKVQNSEISKVETNKNEISLSRKEVKELIGSNVSQSTLLTYETPVRKFQEFCINNDIENLGSAIILYISHLRGLNRKLNTIKIHVAAIKYFLAEQNINFDKNELSNLMKSISLNISEPQKKIKQAKALNLETLISIYENLSKRDALIFSLSFFGAFRVSELINIKISDIQQTSYGFTIELQKSKTLKAGEIFTKQFTQLDSILCPVYALKDYLAEYELTNGFLIQGVNKSNKANGKGLTRQAITYIMKSSGLNDFSTHSFRRGFIVEATKKGATINNIMQQSGHKTAAMVIHYAKQEQNIKDNAISLF